jgi:hypothetical protein
VSWAKLDDGFWMNPKIIQAGNVGAGIFSRLLSYCARYDVDRVHHDVLRLVSAGDQHTIQALTHAGALVKEPDGLFRLDPAPQFVAAPNTRRMLEQRAMDEDFDNALWSDPEFLALTPEARMTYIWSWTNPRCGMAGIYKVALTQAALETGYDVPTLERRWASSPRPTSRSTSATCCGSGRVPDACGPRASRSPSRSAATS